MLDDRRDRHCVRDAGSGPGASTAHHCRRRQLSWVPAACRSGPSPRLDRALAPESYGAGAAAGSRPPRDGGPCPRLSHLLHEV